MLSTEAPKGLSKVLWCIWKQGNLSYRQNVLWGPQLLSNGLYCSWWQWDSARCIGLGDRNEKGLLNKVDMTLFDVQYLPSTHPCFQSNNDDAFQFIRGRQEFSSSPASNLLSLPLPTLGKETIDSSLLWFLATSFSYHSISDPTVSLSCGQMQIWRSISASVTFAQLLATDKLEKVLDIVW